MTEKRDNNDKCLSRADERLINIFFSFNTISTRYKEDITSTIFFGNKIKQIVCYITNSFDTFQFTIKLWTISNNLTACDFLFKASLT